MVFRRLNSTDLRRPPIAAPPRAGVGRVCAKRSWTRTSWASPRAFFPEIPFLFRYPIPDSFR